MVAVALEPGARRDLPDFTNPPVTEVALSVVFEPLPGYTSAHAGLFWNGISDRFTRVQEHPPLAIPEEMPERQPTEGPSVQLLGKPEPRIWLLTDDESELIQLQGDTFVRNWRQTQPDQLYPRYEQLRSRFASEFREFTSFVERARLGALVPRRCEITYVNHILGGEGWQDFGEFYKVISGCSELRTDRFLPQPEETRLAAKYAIRDLQGQFLGRLTVTAEPAFRRRDMKPLIALTLTARGRSISSDFDGVLGFFDIGREWIVRGFTDLTTREMHRIWGRIE